MKFFAHCLLLFVHQPTQEKRLLRWTVLVDGEKKRCQKSLCRWKIYSTLC